MPTLYKFIFWEAAIVALSLLFWRGFSRLAGGFLSDAGNTSFVSGISGDCFLYFLVLAVLICLGIMFFGGIWQILLSWTLTGGVFLMLSGFSYFNLITAGALLPLLLYARLNISSESKERIRINARIILSRGLASIFLALLLMASLVVYQSPGVKELEKADQIPPAGERFVDSAVEQFIGSRIEGSSKEKQSIIKEISRQTVSQINAIAGPYFKFAPSVLTAVLFLTLWGFHGIFVWLGVLIGWPLFFALKKTGFFSIEEKDARAETLRV